jgi:hypothetical protein
MEKLNYFTGYKVGGLFQTLAFKIYKCLFYIFLIKTNDQKWAVIFKSKNKKNKEWLYSKVNDISILYNTDEKNKAFISIKYDLQKVNRIKVSRLYGTKYLITDHGLVINRKSRYVLKPVTHHSGYNCVNLYNTKSGNIHRMVAHAFCPRPEHLKDVPYEDLVVNHRDGNKQNNYYTNLEWCTSSENVQHAIDQLLLVHKKGEEVYNAALKNETVKEIRDDYISNLRPYKYYMDKYSVGFDVIQALLNNKTYYDPDYTVPEFIGKRKMTFEDASWVRKHKSENLKTTLFWYAEKFGVDFSTIGKILQNILHPDPTFDITSVEKKKPTQEQINEIVAHKKQYPNTPLSVYEKKYGYNSNIIYRIVKDNIK